MMKFNLIQYLKEYSEKTFKEKPFSEVDALVLAQLSYLKMSGIVPGFGRHPGISWEEMKQHPDSEQLFSDAVYGKQHRRVFELVRRSRRFRCVRANYFMEWLDMEKEAQFAAVAFFLGKSSIFISFRGTDETLVGWKEDFNMGFMKAVPAQKKALAYLKGVARYTETGRLILGGHSKGGNLALYAAACAPECIQQRIRRIYSFDGPGFRRQFYYTEGFGRVEERFCKIVPEQSVVGMLLVNLRDYRVVRSYRRGVLQHDLLQWKIREGEFVYRKCLHRRSRLRSRILNRWIESLSLRQAAFFVETIYRVFQSAKVQSVYELFLTPAKLFKAVRCSFKLLDRDHRRAFWNIIFRIPSQAE